MRPISTKPGAVIVISSHVVRGAVGNRAAVFALERLGFTVWAVPTIVLSWHPGHGPATRVVPPLAAFEAMMADLGRAPWFGEVAAVLSGYLGEAGQSAAVAGLVEAVKSRNHNALYLCDPVIGDAGGLYVPEATAEAIRDRLLPLADITTPNRFELAWLTGHTTDTAGAVMEAARLMGPSHVIVTSAPTGSTGTTGNLLIGKDAAMLAEHAALPAPPNGSGDLFAALFLARLLRGETQAKALQLASASVLDILARAIASGADELRLAADAKCLEEPQAGTTLRPLVPEPCPS